MTPLRLTSWFRRRMLVLVVISAALAWLTITVGYHVQERREMVTLCRADATRVAAILAETIQQRPRLWRYDAPKFADRLGGEWLRAPAVLVVHDERGARVEVGPLGKSVPSSVLWGRAEVRIGPVVHARVWVGADARPLWNRTLVVALLAALAEGLLAFLLYLLPVRAIRTAEQRIAGLMTQLSLNLREEERSRIARDLHDGAGQALTAARLNLMALQRAPAGADLQQRIEPVVALVDEALDEVRRSTAALMPPAIADLGLHGAIERHCEAFASASGLEIAFEVQAPLPEPDSHVQTTCYRIIQEALTNIARHASAQHARVHLAARERTLLLTVTDDGAGIDGDVSASAGTGLRSIQTRAALLGGSARIFRAEKGTCLEVELPCDAQG
ncbi:MAG: sensor histidine kinase [Deltaproteobacteria bacterium]|nr:sensor histidine kinase [Deltaproteobacteria bacterium]